MNAVMEKEELERILDQAVQDVTERTAGVLCIRENSCRAMIFVRYR